MGKYGRGNDTEVDAALLAQQVVDDLAALERGGMGQQTAAVCIAYGIDVGHVGLQVVVGLDAFG